ncbi:MAG TPA: phosphoribosyl-ATP diphosphatase [Xanthobacteraceae bacterium]|jgi:phosphoribosyl-ATP pyrophosphohydrolase|nr:phosphoribosyl-ATP diphosphatase [Xanthobacteraceae bacterium]
MKKIRTSKLPQGANTGANTRPSASGRALSLHTLDTLANGKSGGITLPATQSQNSGQPSPTVLEQLSQALEHVTAANHPRTFKLLQSGAGRMTRKLIEEACEVSVEAFKHDADGIVRESADLLYHLIVLWFRNGVAPAEVWREMQARTETLGIAEKLPKAADGGGDAPPYSHS